MPENKQPGKYDAVIKRVPQAPMYGAVIGGIQGVKRRFESARDVNLKAEILQEALQYENQGIEFILQVVQATNEQEILAVAYDLLKEKQEPTIQNVLLTLKRKHPWLDLSQFSFDTVKVNRKGEIIKREQKTARYYREDLGKGINLDMVYIQGGTFMMGSPDGDGDSDEKPQHQVTVSSFFMAKYPVTQAQWKAVASLPKIERDLKLDPSRFKGDNRPVEKVNQYDAVEFCHRLSKLTGREYTLPSEAKWEYSCRAGTTTTFNCGETITTDLANYNGKDYGSYADEPKGQYRQGTTSVGSFPANDWGLSDMHGNVWEWCADEWHGNYNNAPTDGNVWTGGESNRRVMRGGSWLNKPYNCRCANRRNNDRDYDYDSFNRGFRVMSIFGRTS